MPSPQQARAQASAITSGKTAPEAEAAPASQLRNLFDRPRLSPGQRRIAQYLIEHITEAAFLSITDLAERVGVSQPSVTRFAAAVGFSGYPALREKLQSIALGTLAGGPGAPEENGSNELQAAVDAEIENLENLRRDFADPDQLIEAGRKLSASTPLTVLGLRISVSLAEYFAYAARRIHPDVRLVTRGGSVAYDALLQSREAGGTWVLAFSMPRHAHETLTAVQVGPPPDVEVIPRPVLAVRDVGVVGVIAVDARHAEHARPHVEAGPLDEATLGALRAAFDAQGAAWPGVV